MHSRGNYKQGERITIRMGENDSKWNNLQRVDLQNIQAAHVAQDQKNRHFNQKVDRPLNRHSLMSSSYKEDIQMANKHMERCPASLIIQFSCPAVSASLWYHGLQDTRLPCPSPAPGAGSNSRPSRQWCHPTISSSVVPFSSCLQSFTPSGFFSKESLLCIRWPKYWSFSFSIGPSNEYSGLTSFRIDWFDPPAVQGALKSILQHPSSKASILWCSAVFSLLVIREM